MALRGRKSNNFAELWCLVASRGLDIWVSWTSFQKSNISWPQQPPTEKVLKFNMIFHDSTKKFFVSKHQNKATFKNLDDSENLSNNFSGLKTSAASLTSLAHMQPHWPHRPLQPYFIKELPDSDDWIIPDTKMTNTSQFLWNGSSKIQFFQQNSWSFYTSEPFTLRDTLYIGPKEGVKIRGEEGGQVVMWWA